MSTPSEKPPIMRRKAAYGMYCYTASGKKCVLFYPFIPRRNSRMPAVMAFRRGKDDATVRHFRFQGMESETIAKFREFKPTDKPNK